MTGEMHVRQRPVELARVHSSPSKSSSEINITSTRRRATAASASPLEPPWRARASLYPKGVFRVLASFAYAGVKNPENRKPSAGNSSNLDVLRSLRHFSAFARPRLQPVRNYLPFISGLLLAATAAGLPRDADCFLAGKKQKCLRLASPRVAC